MIFALIIPLITLTYQVEVIAQPEAISEISDPLLIESTAIDVEKPINYLPIILWSMYGIGVLIFGFRFIRNITDISKKIKTNERLEERSHINVLLSNSIVPHTFLSYIFVPKKDFLDKTIPEEVLLHEKTHVLQKHTLDILFVEVLQVIFWFNPLFVFLKRSIKLNHEFLADRNVLRQEFSIHSYFNLLLNYPNSTNQAELSSPINYSLTKKRLQMMTKKNSKKRVVVKLFACIPVFILCVLFFNHKIIAREIDNSFTEELYTNLLDSIVEDPLIIVLKEEEEREKDEKVETLSLQDGVTKEDFEAYNIWAKDATDQIQNNKQIRITAYSRMKAIYDAMSPEQRARAEAFPDLPEPPPVPEVPEIEENIPLPPPPPPLPKTKNGKNEIQPPSVPVPPSPPEIEEDDRYEFEVEIEELNGEEIAMIGEVENEIEDARMYLSREEIANIRKSAMEVADQARRIAREHVAVSREMARVRIDEARIMAREQAEKIKEHAMIAREIAREQVEIAREEAQEAMESIHRESHEEMQHYDANRKKYEKKARKAEKELEKAEKKRRDALKNLREAQLKALQSRRS
ncbi:M56 family metallopeptidase [Aquimarina addita]